MWVIFSMSYKIMKIKWYKLNNGSKKIIYRKTVDGLFLYLFGKEEIFIAGKEFKGKDKKVAKMTRDGLIEENLHDGSVAWWLICFSSRSFLRYSDREIEKQAAPWSSKLSSISVSRTATKCLWFNSFSLFTVLVILLPLRWFFPLGVHVFQYRLSLPILEIVLWTPLGGTNRVDLALICIPLYNETLRGCFTVGGKKKYQKNDD